MIAAKEVTINILHICTKNTTNGNPRRLYVFVHGDQQYAGQVAAVCEEGYAGLSPHVAYMDGFRGFHVTTRSILRINVAPSEYNRIKREAKEKGCYHH